MRYDVFDVFLCVLKKYVTIMITINLAGRLNQQTDFTGNLDQKFT